MVLNPKDSTCFLYGVVFRKVISEGIVKVELNIPQFNGDIRLMALVYSGSRFGSAEEHMKVADDIIIEAQVRRFQLQMIL